VKRGVWCAIGAYFTWGLVPIYWKWLNSIPAFELINHRVVWSCLILVAGIVAAGQWKPFRATATPRVWFIYLLSGVLIGINWLVYVWAVNAGFIIETSLGYFINPLVSILLGVFVLGERLRPGQWPPIGLAALGVLYLTFVYGAPPWISLSLATTFGLYGLVKKWSPLGAVHGLALETAFLLPPALLYLAFLNASNSGAFLRMGWKTDLLLIGGGVITTLPLLLFAAAARSIPLSLIGLFQYIAPTIQFVIGVFVFKEPFTRTQLTGFIIVWLALTLLVFEGAIVAHRARLAQDPG
jgi:chloramphenicol-sensitive protein RarD